MVKICRRQLMGLGVAGLATAALQGCGGASAQPVPVALPYPDIADTSGATPELVEFMKAFFAAKSSHDLDRTMSYFAPDMVTYIDATLGWDFASFNALKATFQQFMPGWPAAARSYPTRIMGDMTSGALVAFTNTPELFGGEIRALGVLDFKGGKIVRWVDHWDFNSYANLFGLTRANLTDFRQTAVGENANPALRSTGSSLFLSLSRGDAAGAAALLTYDAVYEDMALRIQINGREAIQRYLSRSIVDLPFGSGVTLRHAAGSAHGGGVEWNGATASPVKTGVTALMLDTDAKIVRLTSVYDAALLSGVQRKSLLAQAIDA